MTTMTLIKNRNSLKVKFLDKILWQNHMSKLGYVSTIVTLLSFFFTANDIKINTILLGSLFILLILGLYIFMWLSANHRKCATLRINNTKVSVSVGDIWELLNKAPADRDSEISIIGVNNYYDVIVDERIIAAKSLHGQYINKIIAAGKLSKLNQTIENDPILNKPGNYNHVSKRKNGRQTRYEIGSVVEFESYVLAAFAKFDDQNKAWLTAEEYIQFWMRFWKNIDTIYAGRTINIPLMGAGITRFRQGKPSKQELLETMLWTMKISRFQNTYTDGQINIIIYSGDAPEIDFYHIQHNPNLQ